jgi:hypothetical protein
MDKNINPGYSSHPFFLLWLQTPDNYSFLRRQRTLIWHPLL